MQSTPKIPMFILGITALVGSRILFALFDDPEGPNLLVVTVMALLVFIPSKIVHARLFTRTDTQRFLWALLTQVLLLTIAYFVLT